MFKLTLRCKTITPMFMYGADKNTPELRASEFKGMMRWWWRAIKSESDVKKLRKEEAQIFGGTEKGEGKSKVKLIVRNKNIQVSNFSPVPHKEDAKFSLEAITGNFNIDVECDDKIKDVVESTLFITFTLGGFGRRARRGFGSIYVEEFYNNFESEELILQKIVEKLEIVNGNFDINNGKIVNKVSNGDSYPWIKEIMVGNIYKNNYDDLLNLIGQDSHTNRDNSLGSFNPRMASPVYVSILKIDQHFFPVITKLNSAFPRNYGYNLSKQNSFINMLQGE